jgi:RHS repeat-associated protein
VGTGAVTSLATDGLGSVSAALDGSGTVTAAQLYGPYGQTRYTTGTMPTTKGDTGQRADAASGLDYYNARYYDPATDQFASADNAAAGLNRYAYVAGNPETATDPTGHRIVHDTDGPQRNDDNWVNYVAEIRRHRQDDGVRSAWFDDRWHVDPDQVNNKNQRRAYAQEKKDGPVLARYFGLTVLWPDDTGQQGRYADYLVGLDMPEDRRLPGWLRFVRALMGQPPLYSSDAGFVEYGTPVDLYYPQAGSAPDRVRSNVASKHSQAPVVAVDISDNSQLKGMTPDELQAWADNVIEPGGNPTVGRVIVISNGAVVYDTYSAFPWGPPPADAP